MIIVHRCEVCSHIEQEHKHTGCSHQFCGCNLQRFVAGPSAPLRTFATDGMHAEVTAVAPPGSRWYGGGPMPVVLCGCGDCWALAEELGVA